MKLNNDSMLPFINFNFDLNLNFNSNFLLLFLLLLLSGCKQPTQPKLEPKAELKLTLEDVSCTEAWIQLTTTNLQLPATLTLYKNNVAQNNILCYGDTLLYIDSLLPNQTYKFKVVLTNNPQPTTYPQPPTSNEVTVTTMDTTSHNFTWQSWEFGGDCGSSLYDVAIIDENNIWAVGEIYMRDSLGNCDPKAYNAVHWDGTEWKLKRIIFYTFCPQGTGSGSYPATSIFALDNENIVISSGSQLAYLKNGIQIKKECIPVSVNKLWGSSSSDLYAVGNNGNIAHWDGMKWRKIESGTNNNISSIYGVRVKNSDTYEVLCTTNNIDVPGGVNAQVIKIANNKAEILNTPQITTCCLKDIWFKPGKKYIVVGAGMWESNHLTKGWKDITLYPPTVKTSIAGNDYNDVIVVGSFETVAHWNGYSWRNYFPMISSVLSAVEMKSNLVVIVGFKNDRGYILMGKR